MTKVEVAVRYPNVGGECPTYDAANRRLAWVDALNNRLCELRFTSDSTWELGPGWNLPLPPKIVVPRAGGGFIVSLGPSLVAVADDGEQTTLATFDTDRDDASLDDAKCDRQGRLVTGWRVGDYSAGGLLRVDPDGSIETLLTDVRGANGLDWSPDGQTFYYIDSFAMTVDAFDWDADAGRIGNRRVLVRLEHGEGLLDGMCTDHEGCLWVPYTYNGEIRRFSPGGELVDVFKTGTPLPTSCAFGGPNGDYLFITSHFFATPWIHPAGQLLDELGITAEQVEATARDEVGGALYVLRPGVTGPPGTPFAG